MSERCPQCQVRLAWKSPMIPPRIGEKITIPDMGRWVKIETLKKFQDRWTAFVTTSTGKRKWIDSRKIAGWIPFPYAGPIKELPKSNIEGREWAENWESSDEPVMRKAHRWIELNCKMATKGRIS